MKKNFFLSAAFLAFTLGLFAQQPSGESITKRFSLQLNANQDFWQGVPDSIDNRFVNQGIDVYGIYNFPMDKKGHLFFFAGGGIGAHNFYHNSLMELNDDGVTVLRDFPTTTESSGAKTDTKTSKFAITYFDIPFGFMYKTTNKFHATLGFKVGWNINDHWKYKGNYFEGNNDAEKIKWLGVSNIQKMHYGPYVTFGYKWIGVSAFYQISSIFTDELGPNIHPISVGLTFKPF